MKFNIKLKRNNKPIIIKGKDALNVPNGTILQCVTAPSSFSGHLNCIIVRKRKQGMSAGYKFKLLKENGRTPCPELYWGDGIKDFEFIILEDKTEKDYETETKDNK